MKTMGIVVAGGRSSRMGKDKATLMVQGRSFLDHALTLLDEYGVDTKLVLGMPEHPLGIADPDPGAGPAANISVWITAQAYPLELVVLPVDMPLLTPEQLRFIAENGGYFEDLYLPFVATISRPMGKPVSRVQDLVKKLGLSHCKYPPDWQDKLVNFNRPKDLETLEQTKKI